MQSEMLTFLASIKSLSLICVVPGGQAEAVEEGVDDDEVAAVRAEVGVGCG